MGWLENVFSEMALAYGYLGLFAASFLGNIIPLFPVPYLATVFLFTANVPGADPFLAGVVSGVGGGLGKLPLFLSTTYASRIIEGSEPEQLEAFRRLIGNYGSLIVFIFAATPSPDDVVIAVLGLARYSVLKFLAAIILGKIVISLAVAYTGSVLHFLLGGGSALLVLGGSVVFLLATTYIVLKVNWVRVLRDVEEGGWGLVASNVKRGLWRRYLR